MRPAVAAWLAGVLLAASAAAAPAPAPGPVLSAMEDELKRSRTLALPGLERPYFIEYTIDDVRSFAVSATGGGVVSVRRRRMRVPDIKVRVGDYRFDDTNYVGSGFPFGSRYDVGRFPLDDLYPVLRRFLWLGTDSAYKSAVEALARKRAALKSVTAGERLDDFARAEPTVLLREIRPQSLDEEGWIARARELSSLLARRAELKYSTIELEAVENVHHYVNTEGSRVRIPERMIFLRARALAQAADGMHLRDAATFHASDFDGLDPAALARAVAELSNHTAAMARAPVGKLYSGPVLFEGAAAAQLFAEVLGGNLAPTRRPVTEPRRPAAFPSSQLEGRQGARVLPEWMDVIDDPTQTEWRGRRLFGSFLVDREGVRPQPLVIVEKGVLKNFLLTRQPVRGWNGSNGRARLPGRFGHSTAAISNLFVRAAQTVPAAQLRKRMAEICETRGKPYGIVVRKMDFPSSASTEEVRRLLAGARSSGQPVSLPVLVYRVWPDGREELVRGLKFRGLNARSLKDILAAGDEEHVFDYLNNTAPFALMGLGGYVAETSVVAPSVLIDDLELEPVEEEHPKLPLVAPPPS